MNYAPRVVELLCSQADEPEVVLVPGSLGLMTSDEGWKHFTETPLSVDDVLETLTALLSRLPTTQTTLHAEGVFAFGVPKFGRFRVAYLTQRGSYAVNIRKITNGAPALAALCDAEAAARAGQDILGWQGGLLTVASSRPALANRLAYALVEHVSQNSPRVLCTIEPCLTYALKHQRGVVMQMELGADDQAIRRAMDSALLVGASLVYIRDVRSPVARAAAVQAAKAGALVLVSAFAADLPLRDADGQPLAAGNLNLGTWVVEPGAAGGPALLTRSP